MYLFRREERKLSCGRRACSTFAIHWRGIVIIIGPLLGMPLIMQEEVPTKADWCAYVMVIMAVYWVSECIPLPVTGLMPVAVFPLLNIISTYDVCKTYFNATIMMFLASLMLAAAVEQSGLHLRIALRVIDCIGFSHLKLFFAVGLVTMVISMWITNTAATTMMVPIVFAVLRTFERNGYLSIYETTQTGESYAGRITVAYFCMTTYAATIGGIGTLVGTGTNLVFKGLFMDAYPNSSDSFSFIKFSMFSVPLMLSIQLATYILMSAQYFGLGRPWSKTWKKSRIPKVGSMAARKAVQERIKALGRLTYWEFMVLLFFAAAMGGFFSRSPQFFEGWGDILLENLGIKNKKFIADATWACFILFMMMFFPSEATFWRNFRCGIDKRKLPHRGLHTILRYDELNRVMPWTFSLLLGGGFALSTAANKKYSDLNGKIGRALKNISFLPHPACLFIVIAVTTIITNFASNVIVCNVLVPVAMELAQIIDINPKWYVLATGICASFCFCLPVGTPGNLVVQAAATIRTQDMMVAGFLPTVATILLSWGLMFYFSPVIWPEFLDPKP